MKSMTKAVLAVCSTIVVNWACAQETDRALKTGAVATTSSSAAAIKEVQPQNVATSGLTVSTTMTMQTPALKAAKINFPPTPAPRAPVTTMTQQQLDDHILPKNILSQTSDVIAISYNGFRRSMVDPCGCVSHQLGGLDKEAKVVERLKELNLPIVVTDAGGYVRDNPTDTDLGRTGLLLSALHDMGAAAVNVGYTDLSGGVDKLKTAAAKGKIELLSANVTDAEGKLLFAPYSISTVKAPGGDVKVAFVGVTRPRVPVAKVKQTSGTKVAATPAAAVGAPGGYTITEVEEALQKYVPEARQKADLVVALVYDRRDKVSEILKDLPAEAKPDVAISGEYLQPQANVLDVNGTRLVSGGYEGRQTGLLTVSVKDKKVVAASNQFIEILQSIPTVPDITKYLDQAKALAVPPPGLVPSSNLSPATHPDPAKLNLGKDSESTASAGAAAAKPTGAKLPLGNE